MNFEDMQKIWNQEQKTYQYMIDEEKLKGQIKRKRDRVAFFANKMEIGLTLVNGLVGVVLIGVSFRTQNEFWLLLLIGVVMLLGAGYVLILRSKRIKTTPKVSDTIKGHLDLAISNAGYIERLSAAMLVLAFPMLGGLWLLALLEGKSPQHMILYAIFIIVVWIASRWEHRKIHMKRKSDLIKLKERLVTSQ